MNTLETWGHIEVLGWALIHFTWRGNLSRFVAGRRPADVTRVIDQHALRGGLRRTVVDVEFAAVHDSDHRPFHAGQNSKRAAASICRATGAATAGRNRTRNRSNSDRYCFDLAATLVIHPASEHYATTAVDDSALAVGRGLLFHCGWLEGGFTRSA